MCSSCSLNIRGPSVWETAGEPLHPGKSYPIVGGKGKPVGNTVNPKAYWEGREGGVAVTVLSRCRETFKRLEPMWVETCLLNNSALNVKTQILIAKQHILVYGELYFK